MAYENGVLQGGLNKVQMIALRSAISWREHRKVKLVSDVYDIAYRGILSIVRPDIYAAVVEKEEGQVEEDTAYDYDEFMKIVQGIKSED